MVKLERNWSGGRAAPVAAAAAAGGTMMMMMMMTGFGREDLRLSWRSGGGWDMLGGRCWEYKRIFVPIIICAFVQLLPPHSIRRGKSCNQQVTT